MRERGKMALCCFGTKKWFWGVKDKFVFRRGRGRAFHVVGPKSEKTRGTNNGTERFGRRNPEAERMRTNARTRAHCYVNRSLVMGSTLYIFLPYGALALSPDDSFQDDRRDSFQDDRRQFSGRQKSVFRTTEQTVFRATEDTVFRTTEVSFQDDIS